MPYDVRTPVFEGDLELLTQMVARAEVDVFEVCVAALVEAFLADGADLDATTEFLVLAATLLEWKTRHLLRGDDEGDDDLEVPLPADLDTALAHLLQGATFKGAARELRALIESADRSVPRRAGPEEPLASAAVDPLESVTPEALLAALLRSVSSRPVIDLYHVTPIRASVSEAMDKVMGALVRYEQLSFFDMTAGEPDRIEVIVRFLAVLELYKRGVVEISQAGAFGDLVVSAREPQPDDELVVEADWDEGSWGRLESERAPGIPETPPGRGPGGPA